MTLSLCMIVKDEAAQLPQALHSVSAHVDEMIVVDTGSTDATVTVAEAAGAQVFAYEWTNDFAAARNAALGYATGDWILVLDADERLTPAGQTLLKQIQAGKPLGGVDLASILMVTVIRHELGAEQSPYSAVSRLFRNHADIRFNRPYHETVDDSVAALQQREAAWQVVTLAETALAHTGYQATAIAQRDKFNRAQTLMAAYLADHPHDPYICNKLGALYGQAGDWDKGRTLLEQGLRGDHGDPIDPSTAYELHYHLGLADRARDDLASAEQHYRTALEQPILETLKLGAYINLGSLLKVQQDLPGAIACFEQAVAIAPDFAVAHYNLGVAHRARGYLEPAIAAYTKAINLNPAYAEAYQNLGVVLFKLGKLPESLESFQRAIVLYQRINPEAALALKQGIRDLGIAP
ncbi:MAG: tetratricopeptide repeat protein [Cyanobacteria bacterium]|nr:tetratricopeptide repeat protein [Cyanobacteriota bacterium]